MARALVHDYCYNAEHAEDATQEVLLGLWEATYSWQDHLESSFTQYAWFVMRRNLFIYLTERADDRPVLSRRERATLNGLREHLRRGQLISSALMTSLSQETGIDNFRLQQIVGYWYAGHCMISAQVLDDHLEPLVESDDRRFTEEDDQRLALAMSELSERDRLIIAGRYLEDPRVKLSELAERLGISIERVRQLESKSLKNLKKALEVMPSSNR